VRGERIVADSASDAHGVDSGRKMCGRVGSGGSNAEVRAVRMCTAVELEGSMSIGMEGKARKAIWDIRDARRAPGLCDYQWPDPSLPFIAVQ
jgi:hypothetical protein